MDELEKYWDEKEEEYIQDLKELVSFPSIAVPQNSNEAPFGLPCREMLDFIKNKANEYGLSAKIVNSAFAEALLKGTDGKKTIAVACHGDVVPVSGTWEADPFTLFKKGDHLVGRGTTDNKGATMAVLYALRYLKENNIQLKSNVRLLVGSAEEIGMYDVPISYPNGTGADLTLVPDSGFPLCYGEKASVKFKLSPSLKKIKDLNGGSGVGVIDRASATLEDISNLKEKEGIELNKAENKVTAFGKGRHSATPEGGEDAFIKLLNYLKEEGQLEEEDDLLLVLKSFPDFYGSSLGLNIEDEESGKLTLVMTEVKTIKGKVNITLNGRLPFSANKEKVINKVTEKIPFSYLEKDTDGFRIALNPLFYALNDISNEEYETDKKPYVMAGGTYARVMQPAVAYGMGSPLGNVQPPFPLGEGRAHQKNESVHLLRMKKGFKIYVKALKKIDEAINDKK